MLSRTICGAGDPACVSWMQGWHISPVLSLQHPQCPSDLWFPAIQNPPCDRYLGQRNEHMCTRNRSPVQICTQSSQAYGFRHIFLRCPGMFAYNLHWPSWASYVCVGRGSGALKGRQIRAEGWSMEEEPYEVSKVAGLASQETTVSQAPGQLRG